MVIICWFEHGKANKARSDDFVYTFFSKIDEEETIALLAVELAKCQTHLTYCNFSCHTAKTDMRFHPFHPVGRAIFRL